MHAEENSPAFARTQFKFGLRQLFYATALIAAGLALHVDTIWISLSVLLGWWIRFYSARPKLILVWVLLGLLTLFLFWPRIQVSREAPRESSCRNNLKNIMLAIHNYELTHGRFPTDRIVTLADGTELRHSWRIKILPMLDQAALYASYNFNEPWNGPSNSKLEPSMPEVFNCPSHYKGTKAKTPYKLVNGPGTAFEEGKNLDFEHIKDGVSNTIGLIEDHANPVNWMEPEDFTAEQAAQAMNSMTREIALHSSDSFFFTTYLGSCFATMDAETHWWRPSSNQPLDVGVFLIADGIYFDFDAWVPPKREIKYRRFVALAIYLILILFPAFFLTRRDNVRRMFAKVR